MKKHCIKFLMILLSIVIVCASLVGCEEKKEPEETVGKPEEGVIIEKEKTQLTDIEEFVTAIKESASFTYAIEGTIYGVEGYTIIKVDNSKFYMKESGNEGKIEEILALVDNTIFEYYKQDDVWYYYDRTNSVISIESYVNEYKQQIADILNVDNYIYSTDRKAFVLKDGIDISDVFGGIEFSDFSMIFKGETIIISAIGADTNFSLTIKDVNSTTVELPINAIERNDSSINSLKR